MNGWQRLIDTPKDTSALLVRLGLGLVMFPHGAQKALGWWGGHGFGATMAGMSAQMHLPPLLVFLVIATEFVGAICLILGFMGRLAALAIGVEMVVAVLMVHLPNGFFMNWMGTQKGEGFEFHILTCAMALAIMIKGSGAYSIDRWLARGRTQGPRLTSTPLGGMESGRDLPRESTRH